MATITIKKLCKETSGTAFCDLWIGGEETKCDGYTVANKGRIFLDDLHSIRIFKHDGYLHLSLDVKTLEDRKKIKEYKEKGDSAPSNEL